MLDAEDLQSLPEMPPLKLNVLNVIPLEDMSNKPTQLELVSYAQPNSETVLLAQPLLALNVNQDLI